MACNEKIARRTRAILAGMPGLEEKEMFGGIGFILHGNMACGVYKDWLIVRVGPEKYKQTLDKPHTDLFDITGRPMSGWVKVTAAGFDTDEALAAWLKLGVDFAQTLPPK